MPQKAALKKIKRFHKEPQKKGDKRLYQGGKVT